MDGKDESAMSAVSFTTQGHPEWTRTMEEGLYKTCKSLIGGVETFEARTIYAQRNEAFASGIALKPHGSILWIDNLWVEPLFRNQGIGP